MMGVMVEFVRQTRAWEADEMRPPGHRELMCPDSVGRWMKRGAIKIVLEDDDDDEQEPDLAAKDEAATIREPERPRRGRPRKNR